MTHQEAKAFCRFAGGRLPTEDEWILAAAGTQARRYPWGNTGAVCRRACWGLRTGPCASGGRGPDVAGIHLSDTTPQGVRGFAGSVREWVVTARRRPSARGGSWRSDLAAELRTWHFADHGPQARFDDVGLRCAYDSAGPHKVVPSSPP
jgi:formylglycine-generating enzyme required for sulfatase activity